jgi:hypothetical protein
VVRSLRRSFRWVHRTARRVFRRTTVHEGRATSVAAVSGIAAGGGDAAGRLSIGPPSIEERVERLEKAQRELEDRVSTFRAEASRGLAVVRREAAEATEHIEAQLREAAERGARVTAGTLRLQKWGAGFFVLGVVATVAGSAGWLCS